MKTSQGKAGEGD
jgi:hypothetical protein